MVLLLYYIKKLFILLFLLGGLKIVYCSKCGVQNADDAKYCQGCGVKLRKNGESNNAEKSKGGKETKTGLFAFLVLIGILLIFYGIFFAIGNTLGGLILAFIGGYLTVYSLRKLVEK